MTIAESKLSAEQDPAGIAAVKEALEVHAVGVPVSAERSRKPSGGEVLFDRVVYTGIGFGVNEASSLWITDQFVHGRPRTWLGGKAFSREGFEAASNWIAKTFRMPKAKAGNALLMVTLLSGGTLLVLPMRFLEEKKIFWTRKANHLLDALTGSGMTQEEVKARDEEVEKSIACSPQQTWSALLVGRAAAMLSSFVTGSFLIGPERNRKIMDWSEKTITGAADAMGLHKAARTDTFRRYAQLIGIETYSCAISSAVLEIVSKMFARRGTEVHDPAICAAYQEKEESAPVAAGGADTGGRRIHPEQFRRSAPSAAAATYADRIKFEKDLAAAGSRAGHAA